MRILKNNFLINKKELFKINSSLGKMIKKGIFINGPLVKKFEKKIVTLIWKFEKFYPAENYHQDYYEKNFIRYLMYKKGCKREDTLKKIWN